MCIRDRVYTQTTAAVLRMKDSTMETVSKVQEQAGDILADACLLYTSTPRRSRQ